MSLINFTSRVEGQRHTRPSGEHTLHFREYSYIIGFKEEGKVHFTQWDAVVQRCVWWVTYESLLAAHDIWSIAYDDLPHHKEVADWLEDLKCLS
jgi:hypothetical protein